MAQAKVSCVFARWFCVLHAESQHSEYCLLCFVHTHTDKVVFVVFVVCSTLITRARENESEKEKEKEKKGSLGENIERPLERTNAGWRDF